MIVVVEGPDGAGKTTLIEQIRRRSKRYFWILRPSCSPKEKNEILRLLRWVSSRPEKLDILFDRHPAISEQIYGPIFRGINNLVEFEGAKATRALLGGVSMIIYCRPSEERIKRNVQHTPQMNGVAEHTEKLIKAYDSLMIELSAFKPVYYYDFEINQNELNTIIDRMWRDQNAAVSDPGSVQPPVGPGQSVLIDRANESLEPESFDPS
jgi:hypothetical protein